MNVSRLIAWIVLALGAALTAAPTGAPFCRPNPGGANPAAAR